MVFCGSGSEGYEKVGRVPAFGHAASAFSIDRLHPRRRHVAHDGDESSPGLKVLRVEGDDVVARDRLD